MSVRLTADQSHVLRALAREAIYDGALGLMIDLPVPRIRVVLDQLKRRGLVTFHSGHGAPTWMITPHGLAALL